MFASSELPSTPFDRVAGEYLPQGFLDTYRTKMHDAEADTVTIALEPPFDGIPAYQRVVMDSSLMELRQLGEDIQITRKFERNLPPFLVPRVAFDMGITTAKGSPVDPILADQTRIYDRGSVSVTFDSLLRPKDVKIHRFLGWTRALHLNVDTTHMPHTDFRIEQWIDELQQAHTAIIFPIIDGVTFHEQRGDYYSLDVSVPDIHSLIEVPNLLDHTLRVRSFYNSYDHPSSEDVIQYGVRTAAYGFNLNADAFFRHSGPYLNGYIKSVLKHGRNW